MMESSLGGRTQYDSFLEHEFSSIYADCADSSASKALMADMVNRQEILFMQFQMQKKGKNFGTSEWRLLKIEQGQLFQAGKGQQDKPLPLPRAITVTRKIDDDQQWLQKEEQFEAKILMHFAERSDITVFFRSVIECNEIAMFLLAEMQKAEKRGFQGLARLYTSKVAEEVVRKIQLAKQQANNFRTAKLKAKVIEHCRKTFNDRACIAAFLEAWHSQAYFHKGSFSFKLHLKEIQAKVESFAGLVKIWAQGTVSKQIAIIEDNTSVIPKAGYNTLKFQQQFSQEFNDIKAEEEVQVQVQLNGGLWRTERVTVNDLRRLALQHSNIQLNLVSKGEQGYLRFSVSFKNSCPAQKKIRITPQHYRMIDQLYNKQGKRFQLSSIHQHYLGLVQRQRMEQYLYVSCNRVRQLMELLRVEELIDKFYSVEPFSQYSGAPHRATFIYQYFLRDYERELYYEIEKLMWNHQERQHKRLLTALKVFDQNLKFIFSDGFYHLVRSLHVVAQRESTNRWREGLFELSLKGVESIAFFLAIGFLKAFPGVFVHQEFVNKRALPYNSLLFAYTLRKLLPGLAAKLQRLELNIEAYFGSHFVSLFCSLFEEDTLVRLLLMVLAERKEDAQSLLVYTLTGAFLAVMAVVDSYSCSYASAEHYMLTFQETCKNLPNKITFFIELQRWREKAKEIAAGKDFQELSSDITEFYLSNAYSGELGEVAQQIYQEFTCYHYKNEHELRKILLLIDRIDVGEEVQALTLTIFQAGGKIYEHQFKGVPLQQLGHFIELRLLKLEELTIICSIEGQSFLCRIDPKEVPSNLYFHFARALLPAQRQTSQRNRHILLQVYIKDNCEIDALQNPLPNKYREVMLETGLAKEDLLFCRKYSKTFRMRENNFNLLYSKLGWLGCHYLIPDERLISLQILSHRSGGESQLHARIAALNRYTRTVYGKALAPYPNDEQRRLSMQVIKQGIRTCYDPQPPSLKSSLSQTSTYNSASRLASYALDNFHIGSNVHFLEFYYLMGQKLPLLSYLSYRPRQFYLLPTFTLQVATPASVCTVIITQKGLPFRIFKEIQAEQIEVKAQEYSRLPVEVEFSYTDEDMYFDDFLGQLRLNILKRVIELDKKENGKKGRRWGSALVSSSLPIPNYKLHYFYEVMNETKQIVQLQFRDKKVKQGIEYSNFGLINGRWTPVACLSSAKGESGCSYLVVEQLRRRKYILGEGDFIRVQGELSRRLSISDNVPDYEEAPTNQENKGFNIDY